MNKKMLSTGIAAILLFATLAMATVPVEAATDLKITDRNLNTLQNWGTWTQYKYVGWELVNWVPGPIYLFDAKYQFPLWVGSIKTTQINDNNNKFPGECVSLVKALSKNNVPTNSADNNHWGKGVNVVSSANVAPGTVIATFFGTGGAYGGHVAIFRDYIKDSQGKITGILVWDQNFVASHAVGRHNIKTSGTGYNGANNYYVVTVP